MLNFVFCLAFWFANKVSPLEKYKLQMIDMCLTDYREIDLCKQIQLSNNTIFILWNKNIQIQLAFSFLFVQLFLRNIQRLLF